MLVAGIHTMPAEVYHADPSPEPSLSASLAKIIYGQSCLHAWLAHPRLNPDYVRVEKDEFDLGTTAHDLLLENGTAKICVINPEDYPSEPKKKGEPGTIPKGWTNNAIRAARDQARENGLVPILPANHARVKAMVEEARRFIETTELAGIFGDGAPEQSMFAQYEGAWIRCRSDWITEDRRIILDYKTTDRSANPESWIRSSLFSLGYDIQAAANLLLNGLTAGPRDAKFVFLVQETEFPYMCSLVGASPSVVETGRRKFDIAVRMWADCLELETWPGYGSQIAWAEVPPWELARIEERELIEAEEV